MKPKQRREKRIKESAIRGKEFANNLRSLATRIESAEGNFSGNVTITNDIDWNVIDGLRVGKLAGQEITITLRLPPSNQE